MTTAELALVIYIICIAGLSVLIWHSQRTKRKWEAAAIPTVMSPDSPKVPTEESWDIVWFEMGKYMVARNGKYNWSAANEFLRANFEPPKRKK